MAYFKQFEMEDARIIPLNLSPFLGFNISSLQGWNRDFIIAGEFISDILSANEQAFMDFYIFNEMGFHTLLDLFDNLNLNILSSNGSSGEGVNFTIKTHYIEIKMPKALRSQANYVTIRLINAFNTSPLDIMNAMDVGLFCCYYDGEFIHQFPSCEEAIASQQVRAFDSRKCCVETTLRLIRKGYNISRDILRSVGAQIDEGERPHPRSSGQTLTQEQREDVMDYYEEELYDFLQTAIKPSESDMHDMYDYDRQQRFQSQGITVYYKGMAKSFLPYVYQHSIRKRMNDAANINCGCFDMVFDIQEVSHIDTEIIDKERPTAPTRPVPQLSPLSPPPLDS